MKLKNAPIVEAVVDIDCDMPPGFDLVAQEMAARDAYNTEYPKFRAIFPSTIALRRKGVNPRSIRRIGPFSRYNFSMMMASSLYNCGRRGFRSIG